MRTETDDLIIRPDRISTPVYHPRLQSVMHPDLERSGPWEYDLSRGVETWLHEKQKKGVLVTGRFIYGHLKKTGALRVCLNLQDGIAIQQKGASVFLRLFQRRAVFLWKSVSRHRDGTLRVPYLYAEDGKVLICWNWLITDWFSNNPALRFRTREIATGRFIAPGSVELFGDGIMPHA